MRQFTKYIGDMKIKTKLTLLWIVSLLASIVLCFWLGHQWGVSQSIAKAKKLHAHMEFKLAKQVAENKSLSQQIVMSTQKQILQEETLLNLRSYVEKLQFENAQLAQNSDIYQSLIEEGRKTSGIMVRKFKLYATPKIDRVRYSLILSRVGVSNELIQGEVDMAVHGQMGSKLITLPVRHFNLPEHQRLKFNFKHFQELSGELDIPEGFTPTHVSVRAHQSGQSNVAIEEWFNWGIHSHSDLS